MNPNAPKEINKNNKAIIAKGEINKIQKILLLFAVFTIILKHTVLLRFMAKVQLFTSKF